MHNEIRIDDATGLCLLDGLKVKELAKKEHELTPTVGSLFVSFGLVVDVHIRRWSQLDGALVVMHSIIIAVGWTWPNGGWLLCRGN